ncbi:hypothetical protein DFH06DRAFT_465720 [Mycena polygramma]|nr:hypothetical protein DFH06DRAFT_465720 [Mycena polygramma]
MYLSYCHPRVDFRCLCHVVRRFRGVVRVPNPSTRILGIWPHLPYSLSADNRSSVVCLPHLRPHHVKFIHRPQNALLSSSAFHSRANSGIWIVDECGMSSPSTSTFVVPGYLHPPLARLVYPASSVHTVLRVNTRASPTWVLTRNQRRIPPADPGACDVRNSSRVERMAMGRRGKDWREAAIAAVTPCRLPSVCLASLASKSKQGKGGNSIRFASSPPPSSPPSILAVEATWALHWMDHELDEGETKAKEAASSFPPARAGLGCGDVDSGLRIQSSRGAEIRQRVEEHPENEPWKGNLHKSLRGRW